MFEQRRFAKVVSALQKANVALARLADHGLAILWMMYIQQWAHNQKTPGRSVFARVFRGAKNNMLYDC